MRNDEACAALHDREKGFLDMKLRPRINAARCLIQNENGRIRENDARNGKQLALALT
ncbi:hypothetical protein D3C71_2144620 [compost metagenome]